MDEVKEKGRRISRLVGRGRDEKDALYLHFSVLIVVGFFVAVVVGLVFLARLLAGP